MDEITIKTPNPKCRLYLVFNFNIVYSRVADPDWIRIQSGQWIRIRIRNPDPDPGGQKLPTKVEKNSKSSCFEVLDGLF
jgi:hypothetical protein